MQAYNATNPAKAASAPLYFVRGGNVDQGSSNLLYGPGDSGFYWSSTPYSNTSTAYYFNISGNTGIDVSNRSNRRMAFRFDVLLDSAGTR